MNTQRFEALLLAYEENALTPEELAEFKEILGSTPAARQRLVESGLLQTVAASQVLAKPVIMPPERKVIASIQWLQWFQWRPMAAAAAVLLVVFGFAFWRVTDRDPKGVPVAVQKGVWVDILAASESPYQVGQRVALERLAMQTGSLRFRISSGAVVDCEGPVNLEFVDPMRLRLVRGSINTDVGNEAKGFVVETPSASVLDIGTRFGTSVCADGSTDIAVFEGEVQVYRAGEPLTPESRLASLVEGEAARMSARDAKLERLNLLTLQGGRLKIRGVNAPHSAVVLNVSDNIKRANFYWFYSIVPGGMAEGALASLSRMSHLQLKWHAMPDQPFPPELLGADVIGSFRSFAKRERGEPSRADISLDLSRPCAVYVLFDKRATPPEWLQRDFRDTGLLLRSGPWGKNSGEIKNAEPDANGEVYFTHSVWRRDVLSAAIVSLGPPGLPGERYPYAMYGIAVKALE